MKIAFLQPGYAHYRDKLFDILSFYYKISFLYETSKRTYPGKSKPKNTNFIFVDKLFKNAWLGIGFYLIKEKPDIVITSVSTSLRTFVAFLYTTLFRKKLILWILEWKDFRNVKTSKYFLKKIKFLVSYLIIKMSSALIAGGTNSYKYLRAMGSKKEKIFTAFQSAEDLKFQIKNGDKGKKKFTFLFLSRIIDLKGLDILIKAYSILKKERNDVSLLVAGDGPFKVYCEQLCLKLKLNDVIFWGRVEPPNLAEVYQKAKIFVLPSYFCKNQYEAWGLVINEAMSMSLPVITTTAVGAAVDLVVNGENGFIVEENNVIELYNAMKKILDMDLFQMGKNSRRIFEKKNNYYQMASGFIKAIRHVSRK
jgi:glycosyltransferase involved in cell wall biosynthesis